MFRYFEQSDRRYEQLHEEANRQVKEYQKTLEEDLRVEKENRLKKAKLTQQLQVWLNKYDKDAGARTKELNALSDTLRTRQEQFDNWKKTLFDPQEKKYCLLLMGRKQPLKLPLFADILTLLKNGDWTNCGPTRRRFISS